MRINYSAHGLVPRRLRVCKQRGDVDMSITYRIVEGSGSGEQPTTVEMAEVTIFCVIDCACLISAFRPKLNVKSPHLETNEVTCEMS